MLILPDEIIIKIYENRRLGIYDRNNISKICKRLRNISKDINAGYDVTWEIEISPRTYNEYIYNQYITTPNMVLYSGSYMYRSIKLMCVGNIIRQVRSIQFIVELEVFDNDDILYTINYINEYLNVISSMRRSLHMVSILSIKTSYSGYRRTLYNHKPHIRNITTNCMIVPVHQYIGCKWHKFILENPHVKKIEIPHEYISDYESINTSMAISGCDNSLYSCEELSISITEHVSNVILYEVLKIFSDRKFHRLNKISINTVYVKPALRNSTNLNFILSSLNLLRKHSREHLTMYLNILHVYRNHTLHNQINIKMPPYNERLVVKYNQTGYIVKEHKQEYSIS